MTIIWILSWRNGLENWEETGYGRYVRRTEEENVISSDWENNQILPITKNGDHVIISKLLFIMSA